MLAHRKDVERAPLARTTARRRRRAEESRRNPRRTADGTSMVSSQRARARRDRLKRLRAKRRGRTLEVTLAVPMGEAGHGTKVQVPSKTRSQIVSRTARVPVVARMDMPPGSAQTPNYPETYTTVVWLMAGAFLKPITVSKLPLRTLLSVVFLYGARQGRLRLSP